jgi:hypothetical protein
MRTANDPSTLETPAAERAAFERAADKIVMLHSPNPVASAFARDFLDQYQPLLP